MPSIVTIFGYSLVSLPYCYFLNRFLVPNYNKYVVIFLHWLSFLVFSAVIYTYLFEQAVLKPILMALELFIANLVLYKGSNFKRLIAVFVMLPTSVLLELPASFFIVYIANLDIEMIFHSYWFLILQITTDVFLLFALRFELKLFKDQGYYIRKYAMLFMVICAQYFVMAFCWGQLQLMEIINTPFIERVQYIFMMAIISFFLDLFMIYLLYRLYQKTKLEITIQKLELEYHKLLDEYMVERDDEEIHQFLRHDIMNYLIHEDILQEKND